jgi:probable F420-dependent oxidoreductase
LTWIKQSSNEGAHMRVGVVFPQTELGGDAGAVRAYGERVEELGFRHVLAYDHVVGADPEVHTGWNGPYDVHTTFHEPLVMFGYLAGITQSLELVTGVIILPQRQTVLVAKQAAEVDLLSGGRLRLGIGIGWNAVEYEALGEDFGTRGKRSAEQVDLLRRLWTEQTVTFDGAFDKVTGAGLAPLPVQRPIPIWIGAASAPGYRRAGRLADGWFPMMEPGPKLDEALAEVERGAVAAGRDPASIGMEARVSFGGDYDAVAAQIAAWADAGASHLSVNTMGAGLKTVDEHLDVLARVVQALPIA